MSITSAPGEAFRDGGTGNLRDKVAAFIEAARRDAAGGLTLVEFGSLAFQLVSLAMAAADEYRAVPGAERKKWVMAAAEKLFDALLPLLPLPARLPIVSGVLKQIYLAIVDGAIESLLPLVRKMHA